MKLLITSLLAATLFSVGDSHKEMLVRDEAKLHKYCLNFFSPMGKSSFKAGELDALLLFSGNYDDERFELKCTKTTYDNHVDVNFTSNELSGGLSDLFGGSSENAKNDWKIYLKKHKQAELNLTFGYGNASVDISDLSITKLKIDNVEADLHVKYDHNKGNRSKMDSLVIDSEFGDVVFDGPELSRAKHVFFDNAYGTTRLNIKGKPKYRFAANVYVGSGKFYVNLPSDDIPVRIVMKEKHLATLKVPDNFVRVQGEMYENKAYMKSNINPLVFNLYGSVGEVIFQIQP